jgi:hypothetical protein
MKYSFKVAALALVLTLVGCSGSDGKGGPRERLKEYIQQSFAIKSVEDRLTLERYLTGEAKTRLAGMSNEEFKTRMVDNKRTFISLSDKEVKPVSDKEVHITYELVLQDQGAASKAKITTKKMAVMVREDGTWFIREVRSLKELFEYENELSLP